MRTKFAVVAGMLMLASPAWAGMVTPTPDPEAGIGIAAMSLLGAGMVWLKRRNRRR